MDPLPHDWFALLALVFTLGLKHGFDADHLATIDGLTRFNAGRRVARWCGCLFSLGHGMVVMVIAVSVGALAGTWQVPQWVDDLGAWIAIGFLTVLGVLNLAAVLSALVGAVAALSWFWTCSSLASFAFASSYSFATAWTMVATWRRAASLAAFRSAWAEIILGCSGP